MTSPARGRADYWKPGDWNVLCYQCGRKRKAGEVMRYWQGYWVCPEHWEPRQPQDFVRAVKENIAPPWVQPPGLAGIPQLYITLDETNTGTETITISTATVAAVNDTTVVIIILEGVRIGTLDLSTVPAAITDVIINVYGGLGAVTFSAPLRVKTRPQIVSPSLSTLTVDPSAISTVETSLVTATIKDILNAVVPSVQVILQADPPDGPTIVPVISTTNALGIATFDFTSDIIGIYTLAASTPKVLLNDQPTITVGFDFTLTAANVGPPGPEHFWGFQSSGPFSGGSIDPTSFAGFTWTAMIAEDLGSTFTATLSGIADQDLFTSITVNSISFLSADATFSIVSGNSRWVWSGLPFSATGTYNGSLA